MRGRGGGEGLQTFPGLEDSANHLLGRDEGEGVLDIPVDSWAKMRVRGSGHSKG